MTYQGHSQFQLAVQGKHILFDRFITPILLAQAVDVDWVPAD
jgi:hypothetical protein